MTNHATRIAVYGASGHTGTFVVNELRRRNLPVVGVIRAGSRRPPNIPVRTANTDDPSALDRAFADCGVIINCAGPFMDTAVPVVEAALRIGSSYLDLAAEQASVKAIFDTYDPAARAAGITLIPAASFFGGLADLMASALLPDGQADEITAMVALDHWWPTEGTRETGERNHAPRMIVSNGLLEPMPLPARTMEWGFAAPFGLQPMVELGFSEVMTISRHLAVRSFHSYLNTASLDELRNPETPPPAAVDANGKSAQRFIMELVAINREGRHRAIATGQDIYAVSAPIAVEAAARLLDPSFERRGALALGQAFDPRAFLNAIAPAHLDVEFVRA